MYTHIHELFRVNSISAWQGSFGKTSSNRFHREILKMDDVEAALEISCGRGRYEISRS